MGRSKGKKFQNRCGEWSFWQSAGANQYRFRAFYNQIVNMAMSRFEWDGLPDTCNEWFLERELIFNGCAVITLAEVGGQDVFLSLQAQQQGAPNMYGLPSAWRGIGVNRTNVAGNPSTGVFVYDNLNRTPVIDALGMYAYELADLMALKGLNRQQQKAPYILKGPQSSYQDMVNLYKQIAGNEPAVIADSDIDVINVDAISTGVQYLADKIDADIENTWRKVYGVLGINDQPYKGERMLTEEIAEHSEPSDMTRLSPLTARRTACDWLNDRFGLNVSVSWRRDWQGKANDAVIGTWRGANDGIDAV